MIAIVAIITGVVLRTIEFARARPLWLDEAMLALNIATRSPLELARPLDYDQTAPLLYLWIERLVVSVGGVSELTLRVLPFIAGLLLLPAMWLVCRQLAGAAAAALATVLVAAAITLVSFTAEAKPYGVDPLVTILAVWLASRVAAAPTNARRWLGLLLGGTVCVLASQPAVFTLGAVGCALLLHASVRGTAVGRRWLIGTLLTWAATFAVLYFALYRPIAASPYMQRFWEGTFLDPRAGDFLLRLRMFATAVFVAPTPRATPFGLVFPIGIGWAIGVWLLWRRDRVRAALVGAPLVLAAIASALGFYPVMDRLYLFAAPLTLLAVGVFAATLLERVQPHRLGASIIIASLGVAAVSADIYAARITAPVYNGVGKQVIADVDRMSRVDAVYVAARSFPLWVFYTTDWQRPDRERLAWAASVASTQGPAHNNAPSRGRVGADEATALTRTYRGRVEVVGLPTGRQYVTSSRTVDPTLSPTEYALPLVPDSGWAEVEVTRMAEAARPRLWVFGSHMFALDGAEPALVAELQRRGVRLLMERRQGTTVAYHVEFPGEP